MARDLGRFTIDKDRYAAAIKEFANREKVRVTYEAMAAAVGLPSRSLADKYLRVRNPYNSWIVARGTGMPTGYSDDQVHPDLAGSEVIDDPVELAERVPPPRTGSLS